MTELSGSTEAKEPTELVPLTVESIASKDAVISLGMHAQLLLNRFGLATFYIDEQGTVRAANPLQVYLEHELAHAPEHMKPIYVKPIIMAKKPRYVGLKPDGSLWEVEFVEPDPTEDGQNGIGEDNE